MSGSLGKISVHKGLASSTREAQFEQLYKDYFDKLYGYAKMITKDSEMAKDVVSDFFFSLWKSQIDISSIEDLDGYFFIGIKNQAVKAFSAQVKEAGHKADIKNRLNEIDLINPEQVLLEKELRKKLESIVNNLPDVCQLAYRLSKDKGLKHAEIAIELGISTETVKTHIARAQKKLKAEILAYYQERNPNLVPDIRLIGQYLILLGYCEFANI